jgi:HSP20 family protein
MELNFPEFLKKGRKEITEFMEQKLIDPFQTWFASNNFRVDVQNGLDTITIRADLAGVLKENIQIDYKDQLVQIVVTFESASEGSEYFQKERLSGVFERQIMIPLPVFEDQAIASFDNGVLTIKLPKQEQPIVQSKKISID